MKTPQGTRRRVLAVWWRGLRHEVVHARRLRRALLCAELHGRGVAHTSGGDAVTVRVDGLWFDVYAWLREDAGLTWVVDHPQALAPTAPSRQQLCAAGDVVAAAGRVPGSQLLVDGITDHHLDDT